MEDGVGHSSKAGLRDWVDSLGGGPCVTRKSARSAYLSESCAGTKSLRGKARPIITPLIPVVVVLACRVVDPILGDCAQRCIRASHCAPSVGEGSVVKILDLTVGDLASGDHTNPGPAGQPADICIVAGCTSRT